MLLEHKDKCQSDNPKLIYDEACLDIYNLANEKISIFGQYAECENCDFQHMLSLEAHTNTSLLVNSKYSFEMYYQMDNATCRSKGELYEHYRYGWNITKNCQQIYIKQPADNPYLPILSAFIILFFFGTIWYMVKCIYKCTRNHDLWRRYIFWNSELHTDLGSAEGSSSLIIEKNPPIRKHPHRIKSLDIFRGLCIMVMIFVNYGGGQYWFFKHSVWNGLTVADLVFPWFLWLMGFSITVSFNNKLRRAVPRRHLIFQVIRRSFILVVLGLMLNSHGKNSTLSSLRFPGVLQRIGVTYLIVGLMEAIFSKRLYAEDELGRLVCLQDIIIAWKQWCAVLLMVVVHTVVTFVVEIPGCGRGYLGPGGLQDSGKYFNCTGGVAGYIDRWVFGDHMYKHPTCQQIYENKIYYDPEGILGTLTSVLIVYFGVQAGRTMSTYTNVKAKAIRWLIWGAVTVLLGGGLCAFSKNDGPVPLNKNLWSLSFVLVVGGMAFFIHTYLYVTVDIMRKWGGRPFFYPGMNPLVLYIAHDLFKNTFPFAWTPDNRTHAAYLAMNLWAVALWVAVSIFLYKRNIFLSI